MNMSIIKFTNILNSAQFHTLNVFECSDAVRYVLSTYWLDFMCYRISWTTHQRGIINNVGVHPTWCDDGFRQCGSIIDGVFGFHEIRIICSQIQKHEDKHRINSRNKFQQLPASFELSEQVNIHFERVSSWLLFHLLQKFQWIRHQLQTSPRRARQTRRGWTRNIRPPQTSRKHLVNISDNIVECHGTLVAAGRRRCRCRCWYSATIQQTLSDTHPTTNTDQNLPHIGASSQHRTICRRTSRWHAVEYAAAGFGSAACDHFVGRISGQRVHCAGRCDHQTGECGHHSHDNHPHTNSIIIHSKRVAVVLFYVVSIVNVCSEQKEVVSFSTLRLVHGFGQMEWRFSACVSVW